MKQELSAVDVAGNVWMKYRARLATVEKQIAADALADPKSPPDSELSEERWKLQGKLRLVEKLAMLFSEEGL